MRWITTSCHAVTTVWDRWVWGVGVVDVDVGVDVRVWLGVDDIGFVTEM